MKNLLFSSILLISSILSYSQELFRATNINIDIHNDSIGWYGWKECDILILLSHDSIFINSKVPQLYIIRDIPFIHQYKDAKIIESPTVSVYGENCHFELVNWINGQMQLYIRKEDLDVVYQLIRLKND